MVMVYRGTVVFFSFLKVFFCCCCKYYCILEQKLAKHNIRLTIRRKGNMAAPMLTTTS